MMSFLRFPHPNPPPRGRECLYFVYLKESPFPICPELVEGRGRVGDGGGYANDITLHHRGSRHINMT
jgi:hypothetical protein